MLIKFTPSQTGNIEGKKEGKKVGKNKPVIHATT